MLIKRFDDRCCERKSDNVGSDCESMKFYEFSRFVFGKGNNFNKAGFPILTVFDQDEILRRKYDFARLKEPSSSSVQKGAPQPVPAPFISRSLNEIAANRIVFELDRSPFSTPSNR